MMKIRVYDFNHNFKSVLQNVGGREVFNNLEYSHSLDKLGSCSFNVLPQGNKNAGGEGGNPSDALAGLDYIYLEDEEENIVWGGILISINSTPTTIKINCIDIRWGYSLIGIDDDTTFTGNALDSVRTLVNTGVSKRGIPIVIDEEGSEVLEDATFTFKKGKDIYSCIKSLVEGSRSRWKVKHYKNGNNVENYMVMRSIFNVSPEGAGINRSVDSAESKLDEKIYLRYLDATLNKNNILDFKFSFDMRGMVSDSKLTTKIGGVPTTVSSVPDGLTNYLLVNYGVVESYKNDIEVDDLETAQVLANRGTSFPRTVPTVVLDKSVPDIIEVGDRVSFLIDTQLLTIGSLNESGELLGATTPFVVRVDEKKVKVEDGYKTITLDLAVGGGNNQSKISILEQIADIKKQGNTVATDYINS